MAHEGVQSDVTKPSNSSAKRALYAFGPGPVLRAATRQSCSHDWDLRRDEAPRVIDSGSGDLLTCVATTNPWSRPAP